MSFKAEATASTGAQTRCVFAVRFSGVALLWTATLISNVGTWMHDVGAGWLMSELSPSPAIVALVQTATTAPIFLFALLAGALADRVDKRKFLLTINVALMIVIGFDGGSSRTERCHTIEPPPLHLRDRDRSRLHGPGLAGYRAKFGSAFAPSAAIALNFHGHQHCPRDRSCPCGFADRSRQHRDAVLCQCREPPRDYRGLVVWKPPAAPERTLPPEPLMGSIVTGIRHASHNAPLKATLLRSFGFFLFASAYWALLPLVARGWKAAGQSFTGCCSARLERVP